MDPISRRGLVRSVEIWLPRSASPRPSGRFSSQGNALSITLVVVPLFFAPYQLLLRKLARYRFMSPCSQLRFRAPLERAGLLIVFAALSGCDVPTEIPQFDVRWILPIVEDTIAVEELLPATGVTISGGNFVVEADTVLLNETLGSLCMACLDSGGLPAPKPLFNLKYDQTGSLATDVMSVELVSGSISLAIQNDLGFDPIRPAAGSPGTMIVTIYDVDAGGRQLARDTLDGAILTDSLPNGALTTILLNLAPGTVSSTIFAEVDLVSPAGDPVPIDLNAGLDITVAVGPVSVSSATLDVNDRMFPLDPIDLDVEDIDSDVVERVLEGSLVLDIQNPFGVGVSIIYDIIAPDTTISRSLIITSDSISTVTLSYPGDDFCRFLGQPNVQTSGAVTVLAPSGPATVTPTQELVFEASLDLMLEVGGSTSGQCMP